MADNDAQQQDRTEQASAKKLEDARRRGQVPRSRELGTTTVMLAAAGSFLVLRPMLGRGLDQLLTGGLDISRDEVFDAPALPGLFMAGIESGVRLLAPFWAVLIVAAIAGPLAMGGWTFSFEQLAPKFDKLNPVSGLKRVFGWSGLSELAKALFKFLIVGTAAVVLIWWLAPEFMRLGRLGIETGLAGTARLLSLCFTGFAAALLLIAAYDVPFQYWQFRRQMRMTKQEVKDEQKETEGRPEIRQRIRQAQHDIATQRMLAEVPKADVIATNPQHYAVALRYDAASMRAPRVIARGTDLLALTIRRIGRAHGITVFEHPPLARALYHSTSLGQEISPRLYVAVAQVLTYVYQLTGRTPVKPGARPEPPDIAVDEDLLVPLRERRRAERGLAP
jgi:flagellar biosynthetic protein FlhB